MQAMLLIQWSEDLSVGIHEIDDQHKKLIGLINGLHDAMKAGQAKESLKKTLAELAAYAVYHFQTEERYMEKFSFPGYPAHKMVHAAFVKKVSDFQAEYEAGKLGLSLELMHFLRDWLTNHIKGTDKHYTALFQKNGLR
jgi:hemerythrin